MDQRYRIFTIKFPPDGFEWCIADGFRVLIARHIVSGPHLHETAAAILATAASIRPRLRLIRGGGQGAPAEPLTATGYR